MAYDVNSMSCDANITNGTDRIQFDYDLADTHKVISGAVVFVCILPLILFEVRRFPIGTTTSALIGSILMVVSGAVTQHEVYYVIGQDGGLTAIFLLVGIMIIAHYFEREMIISKLFRRVLKPDIRFEKYLWWICLLTFLMSSVFSNDVTCVIVTPLVLNYWKAQERASVELQTILLAIATAANIGSVTTIFGNLQMALIASRTNKIIYEKSKLDLGRCMIYLLAPAIFGFVLNYLFLILHYRWRVRKGDLCELSAASSSTGKSNTEIAGLTDKSHDPISFSHELKQLLESKTVEINTYNPSRDEYVNRRAFVTQLEVIKEDQVLDTVTEIPDYYDEQEEQESNISTNHSNGRIGRGDDIDSDDSPEDSSSRDLVRSWRSPRLKEESQLANSLVNLDVLHKQAVPLCQKIGLYRSTSAVSLAEFMPSHSNRLLESSEHLGGDRHLEPADSPVFHMILVLLSIFMIICCFVAGKGATFDIGKYEMQSLTKRR